MRVKRRVEGKRDERRKGGSKGEKEQRNKPHRRDSN